VVNAPIQCSVSVSGTAGSTPFATATSTSITINPPGFIETISPAAGQRGNSVTLMIGGSYTNFAQGSSVVSVGTPGGITVSNVSVVSPTLLQATFAIDPAANPGA